MAISGTAELTDDPDGTFHQEMYDIVRIVPRRVYVPTSPDVPEVAKTLELIDPLRRGERLPACIEAPPLARPGCAAAYIVDSIIRRETEKCL